MGNVLLLFSPFFLTFHTFSNFLCLGDNDGDSLYLCVHKFYWTNPNTFGAQTLNDTSLSCIDSKSTFNS